MLSMSLSLHIASLRPICYVWDMKLFILLLGLIMVVEGLPYVAFPEAMQRWLSQLVKMSPAQLRQVGFISMITGFIILFIARHFGLLG